MWDEIGALARYHGDVPPEVRVLKLAEEVGEAAQALIGVHGWNRRKGQHASEEDLLDELADVMITAGVAIAGFTADPGRAGAVLTRRLATVMARADLAPVPDPGRMRHWTASAIVLAPDDRVLLVDHIKSGYLLFPGGHVAAGESLAEAAVREVREETGIDAAVITGPVPDHPPMIVHPVPFRVIECTAADPVNGDHAHIDGLFVCRAASTGIGQLSEHEITGARWVSLTEMRELPVPPELPGLTEAAIAWAATHASPAAAPGSPLVMVTSNPAKALTAAGHLAAYGLAVEHTQLDLDEIQSVSVAEVALHKARQAYARLRRPVIVEDGGFFIDGLGGFPGALAKAATSMLGLDGLIKLAGLTGTRAAHFESALVYIDAAGEQAFTSTGPSGTVARQPAGHTRPGAWSVLWDIWIPPGADRPVSALSDQDYAAYLDSWRSRSVFTQLGDWLRARLEAAR